MGNSIERANYMKQNPFYFNECNFTFVVNTHMMRQLYLALGRPRITLFGQLLRGSQLQEKSNLIAMNAILDL